jgi:hypothetical protein
VVGLKRGTYKTANALRHANRAAFVRADLPAFSAHAFRKTRATWADIFYPTRDAFKAVSQNIGHTSVIMLRSLKMPSMAQAVGDLIEQRAPAFDAAVPMLSQLLKAEMAEREVRSIADYIKAARFPADKDLSGFDFVASEINEALVQQLHRCEFVEGAENVVLIGGSDRPRHSGH